MNMDDAIVDWKKTKNMIINTTTSIDISKYENNPTKNVHNPIKIWPPTKTWRRVNRRTVSGAKKTPTKLPRPIIYVPVVGDKELPLSYIYVNIVVENMLIAVIPEA